MHCRLFDALDAAAYRLLPEGLCSGIHTRFVEPHARRCARCAARRRRLDRLDDAFHRIPLTAERVEAALAHRPRHIRPSRTAGNARRLLGLAAFAALALAALAMTTDWGARATRPFAPSAAGTSIAKRPPASHPDPRVPLAYAQQVERNGTAPLHRALDPGPVGAVALPGRPSQAAVPDQAFLDGRDLELVSGWVTGSARNKELLALQEASVPTSDDFIRVRVPLLASSDPGSHAAAEAVRKAEQEARVVDPRLARKVTLHLKGASLETLCALLEKQDEVPMRAARGVRDEKLTVLLEERPAREVMREVARLFGYFWARSGEEGHYRYELVQDLKSQFAEEELRSRDTHEALLALDRRMQELNPLLSLSRAELQERFRKAPQDSPEMHQLLDLLGPAWGGIQLYRRLSAAEQAVLASGGAVRFSSRDAGPEDPLTREIWQPLQENVWRGTQIPAVQPGSTLPELPGFGQQISLSIRHSELGEFTLNADTGFFWQDGGIGGSHVLGGASSPSVAKPNNRELNGALRRAPELQRLVTFHPKTACPRLLQAREPESTAPPPVPLWGNGATMADQFDTGEPRRTRPPHVTSAEVWEEVHQQTGMPVVADFYSQLYDVPRVTVERPAPLFEALCMEGDELGVRWRRDGAYLLARSTAFFWNKLKEVPNARLERWRKDRIEHDGLPFEDVLEIASLTDEQLDSARVGAVVRHCWEIPEWGCALSGGGTAAYSSARPWLRWLAAVPPAQRERALQLQGLSVAELPEPHRRLLLALLQDKTDAPPDQWGRVRVRFHYVPAGRYLWVRRLPHDEPNPYDRKVLREPLVTGKSLEETLAAARRLDPAADREQIKLSIGDVYVVVINPSGLIGPVAGAPAVY